MNKKANTRIKTEAADHAVPQSAGELNEAIAEIGRCQRERQRIETQMNEALAFWRGKYEEKAKPHADRIAELTRGVAMYCEAHRDVLTNGGKTKTARLASGEVSWRMRPPSVAVRGAEAVINALKKAGLDRFLRVKIEVDKEAVLADPAAVAKVRGLSISQREDFVIKPDSTELEEVR
jgi:phage host-nuclease inhibitor protein Gam